MSDYKDRIDAVLSRVGGKDKNYDYTSAYKDRIDAVLKRIEDEPNAKASNEEDGYMHTINMVRGLASHLKQNAKPKEDDIPHLSEDTHMARDTQRRMLRVAPDDERGKELRNKVDTWNAEAVPQAIERLSIGEARVNPRIRPESPRVQRDYDVQNGRGERMATEIAREQKARETSLENLYDYSSAQAKEITRKYANDTNPDMPESERSELERYLTKQIYTTAFENNIDESGRYWATAYELSTGKNYKEFEKEETANARDRQKEIKKELEAILAELEQKKEESHNNAGQSRGFFSSVENDYKTPYGTEYEIAEDALDHVNDLLTGTFVSGLKAEYNFTSMASFGRGRTYENEAINESLGKLYSGESLNEYDEYVIKIKQLEAEADMLQDFRSQHGDVVHDKWLWGHVNANELGKGIGTTLEKAPEFAAAMYGTRGLGSFQTLSVKTALKAGQKDLIQYGINTIGKNYALAKARGFAAAPFMSSTYGEYFKSLNSGYSFDENGGIHYKPVDKTQAYLGAVISNANEISSEYIGVGFSEALGWGARSVGNMVANSKVGGAIVNGVRKVTPNLTPQAKTAMLTFGVQADPVAETLGEAWGDIMTTFEGGLIGKEVNLGEYFTMDYWTTLSGVSILYGGTMAAMGAVKSYHDVNKAVKEREGILGEVVNRNLYNTLVAISTSDDVVLASSALADFDWKGNYDNAQDMKAEMERARAYVVADLNVKVMEGVVSETSRLESFRGTIEGVRNIVYQDKAGKYSDIIREAEMDGKKVYIINGYEANTNQYIVVDATTGENTSVDKSKVKPTRELDVDTYIVESYKNEFSLETEKQRVADVKAKALQLDNPTEKDVARIASTLGITLPKVGNVVMLANGNMGAVTEVLSPTEYAVQDPSGTTYKVHFTDILSTDKLTAMAQGALARGEVAAPIASAPQTETTPDTISPDENGITIGAEVTVDGRVGKVRARTQDGKYAVVFEAENGNYEDTEMEFFTGEELASLMGIAPAPTAETPEVAETAPTEMATTEDGSVDIEQMSAEDAAKVLVQRAGTIEEAKAQVKQVIETVAEERKKTAKAEKKASLNDIGKKSAELQALDTRLEFYGEVLAALEGMLAEQQKQTMTEAQNVAEEAGVAPEATDATDKTTEENKPVEQPTSGLIRNGAEMKFTDNVIKMVDFVAKRLGITVEFVNGLKNEAGQPINGDIIGKRVRISTSGTKGVKFIMGHEFFHRMKDLVDEQTYADFVNSIKEYAGEKLWNATIAHQRNVYRNHNARVAKEAMAKMTNGDVVKIAARLNVNIEGLSLEDAKDAVARGAAMSKEAGVAEVDAIFPKMLSYDDALMVEECAADVAGGLVTNTKTFAKYVEDNSSNIALVRGLRKAIRAIRDFFDSFGYTEQQRKLNALEQSLAGALKEAVVKEAKTTSSPTPSPTAPTTSVQGVEPTQAENVPVEYADLGKSETAPIHKDGMVDTEAYTDALELARHLNEEWAGDREGAIGRLEFKLSAAEIAAHNARVYANGEDVSVEDRAKYQQEAAEYDRQAKVYEEALAYLKKPATEGEARNSLQNDDNVGTYSEKSNDIRYLLSAPTFYSNAEFAVRGIKQEKATPEQWLKMIEKAGGLKAGEDKWLGLSDWLKASTAKTLTKDEVLQYIAENDIQIEEVSYADVERFTDKDIYETDEFTNLLNSLLVWDEDENSTIDMEEYDRLRSESPDFVDGFELDYWGESLDVKDPVAAARYLGLTEGEAINNTRLGYTTAGLENKREIALVVPSIEPYNQNDEIHFGDAGEGRAVAWMRFGETTDADGKRVLVIDEIQSKRHQDGREKGYISDEVLEAQRQYDYLYRKMYKEGLSEEEHNRYYFLGQFIKENYGIVPSAPFEKNWAELAFKRMLRYAAENGYDYVAWTTGDQQADRYDIGSVVKDIVAYDTKDADGNPIKKMKFRMNNMGTYNIATNMEGVIVKGDGEMKEGMHLSDITGKPLAEKIMKGEGEDAMVFENGKDIEAKSLEGEELHIGNEGMKAFYDQMLPSFVKKYTKKWGAEVGEVTMPDLEENNTMHAVNVTDSMRESVMQGQPKFSLSEETTQIFDAAKAKFGTTNDMREAGYILPDGSMLDFSGRHQVEGDASFLNGDRTVDHREISDIAYDTDDNETGINTDLGDFLDRGAIRIDSNAGAINLNVAPTKAQKDRLKRLIERNDGYVYIDFGKGWDTEHYAEYEAARASRILGDIDRYFDEGIKPTGNVRFSLQDVNTRFNEELDAFKAGQNVSELHLGTPSPLLRACGVSASEIFITAKTLRDHLKKHNLTEDEIKNLPIAINDPIMVYEWGEKAKSKIIITQIPRGEQRITVAIKMERGGRRLSVNELASVHGKDVERLMNEMLTTKSDFGKDNLKYVNKEIAMQWLGIAPPEGAASLTDAQQSIANIIQNFQNPKIEAKFSLITPEMDAFYLDAVERGDMTTAQQMVMEAAKLAMPNTKVVDEDGNPKVVYHGTPNNFNAFSKEMFGTSTDRGIWGNGFYFSDSEQYAKTYEKRGDKQGRTLTVFLNIENPLFISLRNGGNEGAMYFHELMEKHFTDDIYEDATRTDELMSVAQERLTADIVAKGYDGIVVEYTNHIDTEYVAFEPNQIKSADPVTYDDNGNVIPLSERFNPRKEDIRYSLPTDLLTDFADEFKALQDEYASLDPATIDYKHPFRVHKREVVQKYVDHVADVLGLSCETFVIDAEDDAQVAEAYDRYKKSHQLVSQQYPHRAAPLADLNDFKSGLKDDNGKYATGSYYKGTDFILMIISENDGYNEQNGYLQVNIHENVHGAMDALGITDFEKEMVLSEAEKYQSNTLKKYLDGYDNETDAAKGEEIVAYAINSRLNPTHGKLLLEFFEGGVTLSDIWKSYNLQLPLRLSLTRKILNYLKDGYEAKNKITNNAGGSNKTAAGSSPNATNSKRFASKYLGEDIRVAERWDRSVDTRFHLPDPDPNDVFYDEIPIFDEQGNEVDITTLSSEEAKEILDGKVLQMLEAEYDHNVSEIRREAREARAAVNEAYREAKSKRRKGEKAARTNAARIDEIFGDTPFESLPYEVQALILIATGQAKIRWSDKGTQRGLASELGLKGSKGDKHAYRSIWSGATKSFNEVVHDWWESIGGQERGIDDQDLRNALIEAFQSVQSSKDAMQEIINKYDDLATDRDNALTEIDRNEEKELYEAKSAYEQYLANFELSEGEERTAYYDRAAQFFGNQSLSRVEGILEDLTGEIERNKRKIERLKAENKDVYGTLAEGLQKSKDIVIHALERLRMFAGMEEVDLNDVARLINLVKTARSRRQMNNLSAQATALVQRVSIKKAKTNLMRLLSLKLSNTDIIHKMLKESDTWTKEEREAILKHLWKVSRNGLRVSKAVHKDTKEIVDALAEQVKAFKKETKNMKGADLAVKIQSKLAELEKELHPEVVYDGEGNVQDNANLPTDFNAENKRLSKLNFKSYLEIAAKEAAYHEASATLREKINNGENTAEANANVVVTRKNYLDALTKFNSDLENLIVEGKDKLRDWNVQKEKHEIEIRSMGIRAIGGKKASGQGKASSKMARARAIINTTVNAPYWTFETVLEKIDHNSPYKKGKLYTYFMDKWADANDDLINRYAAHMEEIAGVMRKCFPDDAKNILKLKRNPYALYQYIMRKAESTPIGTLTYKEMGENGKMRDAQIVLNVANAMYVIAMWRQPRYQEAMQEKHGITQSDIDALMTNIASVNAGFLDFMDWVNDTFLPSTRLEYDVVYRKMNGGSMPKEINYFPARVAGHKEVDLANIDNGALPTTPSALKDRMSAHIMPQLGMDYFKVLESHIQDMDNWAAYAELTADLNVLLSSDEFRRRCNDYMGGLGGDGGGKGSLYDLFKQTSLIATGMYRGDAGMEALLGQLQKAWATSNIAFRGWTAVKQISSITTGMFDNWAFYKHAGIAATGIGIYHEIKNAMEISPSLRYRWKSGAAGMEALARETQREDGYTVQRGAYEKGKDFIGDAIKTLVRAGMTPNAAVDLLACSIIVNSVYKTEIARLTGGKREATEEEKRAAVRKAERAFNTTQQSSEGAYLAPVQANPAYGVLTTYMNASFALHRKRMGGIKELWKLAKSKKYRRYLKDEFGVDAAKISAKDAFKDILSGVAGELSFAMMGLGLMKVMTVINGWLNEDDDDEDVAAAKQEFFDSWWQSLLNGYLGGSVVSSWINGFDTSLTPAYDEFAKDVYRLTDDKGSVLWELWMMSTKYGIGIDLESLYKSAAAIENMYEDDERAGAVLMFLNAPDRYVKAFVGDRREGETLEEYTTRVGRTYALLEEIKFDEKGKPVGGGVYENFVPKSRYNGLDKVFEEEYREDMLKKYGGDKGYADYTMADLKHKQICGLLDWNPNATPSEEKVQTDMQDELEYYQKRVAKAIRKRKDWVGDDEGYYDLLMDEQEAKNDLINNYYEYIKQAGLGAY